MSCEANLPSLSRGGRYLGYTGQRANLASAPEGDTVPARRDFHYIHVLDESPEQKAVGTSAPETCRNVGNQ